MKLCEFLKNNASNGLFYTLELTSCVRDTEAYTFQSPIQTSNASVNFNSRDINNINSAKLFIKLLFCHIEHSDCLGESYANRLMIWVCCTIQRIKKEMWHVFVYTFYHSYVSDFFV